MDYDPDDYEDDDQASEFMDQARSVQSEPANVWDFVQIPVRVVQGILLVFQAAFGDIGDLFLTKSVNLDMKKKFAREAAMSIEQITGD